MKKKKLVKWLSVAMAAAMVVTATPVNVFEASLVKAEEAAARKLEDGVKDAWTQDNKADGDTFAVEDGWLHFKASDEGSRNNPGTNPAMLVNPNTFDFNADGYFSFKMKTNNANTGISDSDRFGVYLGYNTDQNGMFVGYDNGGWFWQKYTNGDGDWYSGDRAAVPAQGTEYDVRIEWTADHKMTFSLNGEVVFENEDFAGIAETLGNQIAIKGGTYNGTGTDVLLKDIHYTGQAESTDPDPIDPVEPEEPGAVETEVLSTEAMDVYVAKNFPSVVKYKMKGDLAGKTFLGQEAAIKTVKINGTAVELSEDDVEVTFDGNRAQYVMNVKGNNIDAVITAELVAEANTLAFNITKIENNLEDSVDGYPIQTIEIPNHSLVSVNSTQGNANLKGAAMSGNTRISGDEYVQIQNNTNLNKDYMYAFVSNDELSAGLWSNSENEGRVVYAVASGGSYNTRVMATTQNTEDGKSVGLSSCKWYYHRVVTDSRGRRYMVEETAMPQTKIIIADDMNDDEQIDWQDGAVAYRSIMNDPFKSEEVPELVAYRISMNFGGQAQNPFLTALDNVKRVAMHTDGLGQSVLLKGYANEGHDSAHPDYADIGKRIGGADEMNVLMTKGAQYGARFGIHVNAGEMYPEAKAFKEDNVRRNSDGSLRYGWNWIDQGIGLDSIYDLATGEREARFDALEELVGQNLDFVYVDIWGNNTGSSNDDSWQTRKLSKEINDNGWRMSNEWGVANEYDSTFQHWACDLTYGGYNSQGENSEVMRFLRNHQKDSWVGDFPSYGGAAMMPLLGGYNMKDFEGWQGRNDYDTYMTNLYTHDLTTKFIQHYEVIKWVDGEPVQAGSASNWVPEMEITLRDEDGDTLFIERESNDPNSAGYRNRTMTLNGKVIAQGAPSVGDRSNSDIQQGRNKGTESYLLPWIWDVNTGEKVASDDEKLYHWNTQGGTTEWELPDSWAGLQNVVVYKLTDLGKTEEKTVEVVDGKIRLTAESEIPYVVFKGEKGNLDITWSEGMHIVDAGFNSGNFDAWTKEGLGDAAIAKSQYSNPMMKLSGEISMTQKLTDLEAGKQYAVLVGVDNRSDSKASMTIKCGDDVLASNYTARSIAKNYVKAYTHSNSSATVDGSSYFQNMYVFFTAPEDGEVTLTLAKEAGEGDTYFDDVRIVENDSQNIIYDEDGKIVRFEQDFESNVQGLYPFVVSGIEGVEDNRIHLSELHEPYTQAGWDVKKMDDVIEGTWSVKINGLCGYTYYDDNKNERISTRNTLAYQTIPQNFRFEPGVEYKVSFDYQAGWDETYSLAIGSGEYGTKEIELQPLAIARGETARKEFTLIGDLSGNTWFGIYSGGGVADVKDLNGNVANFGGYKDFVLDNLVIEKVEEEISGEALEALIAEAEAAYNRVDYVLEDWKYLQEALDDAKVALHKDGATEADMENAYYHLRATIEYMNSINTDPAASAVYDIPLDNVTVTAGLEELNKTFGEGAGPKEFAIDGDVSTAWVTSYDNWSDWASVGGWIDLEFAEAHTVDGFRYLPAMIAYGGYNRQGISEYEIQVKTAGSSEYQKVAEGTWAYDTLWKKVTFEPIENVKNVRLVGKSALSDNWWATAAEIRVTSEEEAVIEEVPVDKSGLEAIVTSARQYTEADFAEGTWEAFTEKLAIAEAVLADEEATNYDVKLALVNLTGAIDAGKTSKADKTDLADLIEYAQSAKNAESYQYLVPKVKALFERALADAVAVNENAAATQAQVDAAYDALLSKVHLLDFTGNTGSLTVLVGDAEGKVEKMYTKESWAPFAKALEDAQAVLADENSLQAEIDAARDALQSAMDALVENPIDKSKLEKLVGDASKYEENIGNYVPESTEEFTAALAGAREVLASDEVVQDDIEAAYKVLLKAIFGLREVPNKDKLQGLLAKVEAMDLSVYSAETAGAVKAAYAKAAAVFEDENADQKEVDAAVKALEDAIKAANADSGSVSAADDDTKSDEKVASKDKKTDDKKASTGSTNTKNNVKTGDKAPVIAIVVVMLLAAGAILVVAIRKMKKR